MSRIVKEIRRLGEVEGVCVCLAECGVATGDCET